MKAMCANCRFSEVYETIGVVECRRRAPRYDVELTYAKWPRVSPSTWCGEHEYKDLEIVPDTPG